MAEEDLLLEVRISKENHTHTSGNTTENTLLNAVLNNVLEVIPHLIQTSTINSINQKYSDYGNKTILIIACTNEQVSNNTLETLCLAIKSRYSSVNCIDEYWYRWEPIHYVAKIADPEKLKVILDNIGGINSLTVFSENALHVLLEYEQSVKPINALLYHGPESRDCTIIGTEKAYIIQCAKILIDAGIDINHGNFWNETPICLAARYRYRETVKILLNTAYVDLDTYKEGGMKIREYLKKKLLQSTLTHSSFPHGHEDPVKILFNYLKSENEEAFLLFNNENIKDFANSIDGTSERYTCGNMLQLCFRKGFFEYLQHELYNEDVIGTSIMDSPMLTVFCAKGLGRCIDHLLNNGANPKVTYPNKFPENLLEAAAVRGYYPLVGLLLQHKSSPFTSDDIFDVLPKLFKDKHQLNNYKFYRKYVLSLLLNKLHVAKGGEVLSSKKSGILNNVLYHLNIEGDDDREDDSENICQILKLGASLTSKINSNEMVIQRLHSDILQMHLDDCIENNLFNYNTIIEDSDKSYSEIRALRFLVHDKKKIKVLRHPLLIHFIHNKWLRIFYFFYIDLLLYTGFLLSIYAYMITINIQYSNKLISIIFFIFLTLHFAKECVQLIYLYRLKYFLDTSNYLEICVIIACTVTIFLKNIYSMVIAILFSTIIFTLFLGQLPICAKFTIIFGSTKYFLQYAGFYLMQFFSFALVFYIIFPFQIKIQAETGSGENTNNTTTEDPAGGIFKSMFYTLIMFTGEFNDRVLEPEMYPAFGRIIMTVFIFCMTIILNNLLVGLIVADMDEMQSEGKLYKQVRTANFIIKANSFVKRLHDFKAHRIIKNIINFFHIFKKKKNKVIDVSACSHLNVFDEEDRQYLKDIKNKKYMAYKMDTLKELYEFIQYEKEHHKDIKKMRDISKQIKITHLEE